MTLVALAGRIGRLEDDGSVAVLDVTPRHLGDYLASGGVPSELGRAPVCEVGRYGTLAEESIVAPGASIWGVGLNYHSKVEASGRKAPAHPVLFLKAASALTSRSEPIALPAGASEHVDYEGEIAVMIGQPLRDASAGDAAAAVVGAVAANDVTARDVMARTHNPSLAKSFPGFAQFGAVLADPAELGGLDEMELATTLNGDLVQHDCSSGMLLGIGELLAMISRYVLLRPGDLVLTGTPAGTGEDRQRFLQPGDVVEVSLAALPALRSQFVRAKH